MLIGILLKRFKRLIIINQRSISAEVSVVIAPIIFEIVGVLRIGVAQSAAL